jgi:hypothetical protein
MKKRPIYLDARGHEVDERDAHDERGILRDGYRCRVPLEMRDAMFAEDASRRRTHTERDPMAREVATFHEQIDEDARVRKAKGRRDRGRQGGRPAGLSRTRLASVIEVSATRA